MKYVWAFAVIGVIVAISVYMLTGEESTESQSIYDSGFTYYDIETIQDTLAEQDIIVSAPTAITDRTIDEYCTYFEDDIQRSVTYCTTTAVLGANGETLGNINIGGNTDSPVMAVANLETLSLESNRDEVIAVFEAMVETLVCDCWDQKSSDYESLSAWIGAAQTFYYDSNGRNIESKIDNLGDSEIILEITSVEQAVLQTLIILKTAR